jgi:hypothetical protein
MKLFLFITLSLFGSTLFGQTVFAADEEKQQIIVANIHWYNNKITHKENIPCEKNELLYSFVLKLQQIAKNTPLNQEIFKTIDAECRKLYSEK